MADSNSARHVEAHISVLYLRKQPRNSGSYSQGICMTYHLDTVLVYPALSNPLYFCADEELGAHVKYFAIALCDAFL